jgi:4-amino-4-deoxy-L-arabinose transferase-like glycosyltransferase
MKIEFSTISRNENKFLFLVFVFALILRISFSLYQYSHNVIATFGDDNCYKHFGQEILNQGPFVTDLESLGPCAGAAGPGIGLILSIIYFLFGINWLPVFIVNSILGAFICVLIYFLGKQLANTETGIISSLYSTIYILFIRSTPTGGKEIWMTFFVVIILLLLIPSLKADRINAKLWGLGVVYAFFVHLDERYLVYSPFLALCFLCFDRNSFPVRIKKSLLFTGTLLILMVPWTIRNYHVYHRVIIIGVRTNPFTEKLLGYEHEKYYDDNYTLGWYISPGRTDSIIKGLTDKYDDGTKIPSQQITAMKNGRLPRYFSRSEVMWASFKRLWQPFILNEGMYYHTGYRFISWSVIHNVFVILTYSWLLFFLPFGLYYLFKHNKVSFYIILSIFLIHTFTHILFIPFTEDRYRIPIDPLVIIASMAGLLFFINKFLLKDTNQNGQY